MTPEEIEIFTFIENFKNEFFEKYDKFLEIRIRESIEVSSTSLSEIILTANEMFMSDPDILQEYKDQGLFCNTRKDAIVNYRQCTFLMARRFGHRLKEIGQAFGKNHATVLYGIKTASDLLEIGDLETIRVFNRLKNGIKIKIRNDGNVWNDNKQWLDTQ